MTAKGWSQKARLLTILTSLICFTSLNMNTALAGDTRDTATDAQAGDPDNECPAPQSPTSDGLGCHGADESVGDPMHPVTGNSAQTVAIYSGGGDFPLRFQWYYNSRMRPSTGNTNFRGQWSHSYGDSLVIGASNITLKRGDGRQIVFDVSGTNYPLTLRNSSPAIYGALTKQGDHFVYQSRTRRTYEFNAQGELLKISNLNGVSHTVSKTVEGESGSGTKQLTITHSSGETIQLAYSNASNPFPNTLIAPSIGEYGFGSSVVDSTPLLDSITYPDYLAENDSVVKFKYLTEHANPAPNWLYRTALEAIIDEEGWQKSYWSYSREGYAIKNYLGNEDEASETYDLTPVEAETGSQQHNAHVTTPYGCKLLYNYHAYRKGQQSKVLPWLNLVRSNDTSEGCNMGGVLKHYSKDPSGGDWVSGGLLESGYPNIFANNIYDKYSGWQADIRKNTVHRRAYLNADGITDTVVSRDVYTYHPDYPKTTLVKRYQDDTDESLWQEVRYSYYDGTGDLASDKVNNGRIKTKTIIDKKAVNSNNLPQPLERQWTYLYSYYDADNTQVSQQEVIGPRGFSTVTTYNQEGFITSHSAPAHANDPDTPNNHKITYKNFTGKGQAQTITDTNGRDSTYKYTSRGWLESVSFEGKTTSNTYYKNGLLKRVTNPSKDWTEYEYTSARKLKRVSHSNGESMTQVETVDREGTHQKTIVQQWFAKGESQPERTFTQVFDALDRLVTATGSDGVETHYFYEDARFNNKVTRIVEKGDANYPDRITLNTYTPMGELKTTATGENPLGPDVVYIYDNMGNLTDVIDAASSEPTTDVNAIAGPTTHYEFSGFNQVLSIQSPDTEISYFQYDAMGNTTQKVDADLRTVEYKYDRLNRVKNVIYPQKESENIAYQYDNKKDKNIGVGQLTGIEDQSGNTQLYYNKKNQLEKKVVQLEGTQYAWRYKYNDNNNLIQLTYPSGRILKYTRDGTSQRIDRVETRERASTSLATLASDLKHLPQGLDELTYGNGLLTDYGYDANSRLESIKVNGGNTNVTDWLYRYNSLNSIDGIDDLNQPSQSQVFLYNEKDRLKQAEGPFGIIEYDYQNDATASNATNNGNRKTRTIISGQGSIGVETKEVYSYIKPSTDTQTDNRLWSITTGNQQRTFDYNAAGNIISDSLNNTVYHYNQNNRLTEASNTKGTTHYTYNSEGQRAIKRNAKINSGGKHFHYSGSALLGEYQRDGRALKEYLHADGMLIAIASPDPEADTDNDGLDDDWEREYFENLNHDGSEDSDDDGYSDSQEFNSGLNPTETNTKPFGSPSVESEGEKAGGSLSLFDLLSLIFLSCVSLTQMAQKKRSVKPLAAMALLAFLSVPAHSASKLLYVHSDHLGTPYILTDSEQKIVWRADKKPYGETIVDEDPDRDGIDIEMNLRFAGQYYDQETGLHYNGFRYYDPSTGKYITSDPIGLGGGINTYAYVGGNPLKYIDPFGLAEYLILVGEPGLGEHNSGNNFNRAAQTASNELTQQGHNVSTTTVATVEEFNQALKNSGLLDGGFLYFGHGWNGIIFPGENSLPGTNIDPDNIGDLTGGNFGPDASGVLYSCNSGSDGGKSAAQMFADQLGIPVTGFTRPLGFTGVRGEYLHGANARPPATGPLYLTPPNPSTQTITANPPAN